MNDQGLKQFDFRGASVRTVMIKGERFVAGDVCEILEIENVSDALSRIKSVNIGSTDVENSATGSAPARQSWERKLTRRLGI
jgi:prophage antirepressor-like protein